MTRKVLALALCALMALASAGCGNKPSTSSEPASSAPRVLCRVLCPGGGALL